MILAAQAHRKWVYVIFYFMNIFSHMTSESYTSTIIFLEVQKNNHLIQATDVIRLQCASARASSRVG
jgi:hypothetical protein